MQFTTRFARLQTSAALFALACCPTGLALAQSNDSAELQLNSQPPRPMYAVLPPHRQEGVIMAAPASTLPTWNGSFAFGGTTYPYNMVGTPPSSNATTTVPVVIFPLKIVITSSGGVKTVFDPATVLPNGNSVTKNTVTSPLFDSTTTYIQGGVNVGTTQYVDAYQRANFWGVVKNNPNYHVLLGGPYVTGDITINVPTRYGTIGSPFGQQVALVDINWLDAVIQYIISKVPQIQPNIFPIFLTYNTYLVQSGGCCIGGYHSAAGAQSYMHGSYIDRVGNFAQDVSALSHEIGEWVNDPLVNNNGNNTPCGVLENGDPLENNPNSGGYPYVLHGFTYNLQDLVTLPYFGAPPATSVNGFFTFQGETLTVCQNGS